jgi:hypothetical protein
MGSLQAINANWPASLSRSIDANNFDLFAHPIRGQVDSTAVSGLFDFLFDQLFPVNPKLVSLGFVRIFRRSANLFQALFCLQGDHILIVLADIDFLSALILRDSRLAPSEFAVIGGYLFYAVEFAYYYA